MPVARSLQAAESQIQMKSWLTVIVVIITIATILKTPSDQTLSIHFLYHSNHPGVSPFYRWETSNPYWLSDLSTASRHTHSCRRMSQNLNSHIPKPVPFYCYFESILSQPKHQNLGTGWESIRLIGPSVYPLGRDTHCLYQTLQALAETGLAQ